MREILFKAKTESGRWIEGDLIHYQSGEVAIIEKPFSKYGHEATEICGRTLVLPDTLCQYTGLTDKNGNKIWENDVIKDSDGDIGIIKYGMDGRASFVVYYEKKNEYILLGENNIEMLKIEVIGNIFDNPELLEGN